MNSASHYAAVGRLVRRRRWTWFGRWLEVNGRAVHYMEQGSGPVVLLVHGFGGWSWEWRRNLNAVAAAGYRVIAPDLMGFGFSDKASPDGCSFSEQVDLLRHLLVALDATPAVLVGHSMGGEIAMRLALRAPELVRGLVLVNSTGYDQFRLTEDRIPWVRWPGAAVVTRLALRRRFVRRFLSPGYHDPQRLDNATLDGYLLPVALPGTVQLLLRVLPRFEFGAEAQRYASIRAPALIIWGRADPWWPAHLAERFHHELAGSQLHIYDDAGHFPPEEQPERFNADLLAWLKTLPW